MLGTLEEIKRHFVVIAGGLHHEIQQVAEGHDVVLTHVKEFRKEVQAEFKEVRALIKFSFAELDQRISTLASDVSLLKARLNRLEIQRS